MEFIESLVSYFSVPFDTTIKTFHRARISYLYSEETIEVLRKDDLLEAYCNYVSIDDNDDDSPLHFVIKHHKDISEERILEFISIADTSLLRRMNKYHKTALHYASKYKANSNIIKALIAKGGGKEYTLMTDKHKETAFHLGVKSEMSVESISAHIDVGGKDVLQKSNNYVFYFETPLQSILRRLFEYDYGNFHNTNLNDSFHMRSTNLVKGRIDILCILLKYGMEFQIGGEFGCGGLFQTMLQNGPPVSMSKEVFDEDHWRFVFLPIFTKLSRQYPDMFSRIPFLQIMILNDAPFYVIRDVITRLPRTLLVQDSLNRFPIDLAILKMEWESGMKLIFHASSKEQRRKALILAAKHGLRWSCGMKQMVEEFPDDLSVIDSSTGLFPFMLAAAGEFYDLNTIFNMIQLSPDLVKSLRR